jgi:hypothetical protein
MSQTEIQKRVAEKFIKDCNVMPLVHTKEGGVIELSSLLVDFIEYYGREMPTSPTK